MALGTKHRPQTIEELAGNETLKKSLLSQLNRPMPDIPRAFLFYGLSGGGKTTLAGIVANHMKCNPLELTEVNSANFKGIDNARELEKNCRYPAMAGGVRVWILNEVHAWLKPMQDAMLDVLEKAPTHCMFILTTTDPQKLSKALRDRCVGFEVLPLTDDEMYNVLVSVLDKEQADVPDDILDKIIGVAQGCSRKALELLDKVIDLDVKDMKSVSMQLDDEETIAKDLFDALISKKDWKTIAKIIKTITVEPEAARYSILGLANAMLLGGYGDPKRAALVIECFKDNFYDSNRAGLTLAAYSVVI